MKFANGKKNADMKYLSVVLVYASCNEKSIVFWKINNVFLPIVTVQRLAGHEKTDGVD